MRQHPHRHLPGPRRSIVWDDEDAGLIKYVPSAAELSIPEIKLSPMIHRGHRALGKDRAHRYRMTSIGLAGNFGKERLLLLQACEVCGCREDDSAGFLTHKHLRVLAAGFFGQTCGSFTQLQMMSYRGGLFCTWKPVPPYYERFLAGQLPQSGRHEKYMPAACMHIYLPTDVCQLTCIRSFIH